LKKPIFYLYISRPGKSSLGEPPSFGRQQQQICQEIIEVKCYRLYLKVQ